MQLPRPLPVVVLADVSGSMAQDGKIDVLNQSISAMIRSFAAEDTVRGEILVGVVTFGGDGARLHHPPVPAREAQWTDMAASGRTPLGGALDLLADLLQDEEIIPRRAFQPTLVLVSDGMPTDEWHEALTRLLGTERGGKAVRLAVGIGQDMDQDAFTVLNQFVANPAIPVMRADEIHRLSSFFAWVTMSVTTRVRSGRPEDPAVMRPEDLLDFMN
ncbi:VWA domain-containing protein [Micromonospora echinospora]|uniref:vWA domain-containing protein n=1 Tax=Micromonospora echinospora TaxID=1877 RepID=UPI0033EB1C8A